MLRAVSRREILWVGRFLLCLAFGIRAKTSPRESPQTLDRVTKRGGFRLRASVRATDYNHSRSKV